LAGCIVLYVVLVLVLQLVLVHRARCSMVAFRVCCWLAGCGSCIRHVGQAQLLLAGGWVILRHLFPQLVLPGW
jgi:hypothetical protein